MARRSNDPIRTGARKAKAQRRVGQGAACAQCGESRPEALVTLSRPKVCEECFARKRGAKSTQTHHLGGEANSPLTVEVRANVHRAKLTEAQREWPPPTLQNPDGSPLLAAAGAIRGGCDFIVEVIAEFFECCAAFLEALDAWMREKHGEWWVGSPFQGWQPG